ncbi:T9SS type A sorting domain-containing protein [Flavobacterium sp. RHBU_3]|uniref:T9SS type A sorting domain-containing protein n=1 Tax=Flavobacterium sp. RHBU_3 TaxID=3391184 RepID=UPI00398490AA
MKLRLLFCLFIATITGAFAQQQAVIQGDEMLCPGGTGNAMVLGIVPYDSYQWQVKAYGESNFTNIEGAIYSTFQYDAYTYSVTTIRAQVSQNGETFYSNELFIDSMVFLPIFYSTETTGDVTFDPNQQGYILCEGGAIINTVGEPYTNVQWYKDEVAIEGATGTSYTITAPGTYYAIAAPADCPQSAQTTLPCVVMPCTTQEVEAPVIDGDLMLCPWTNGTAIVTNGYTYDTYQWYSKFWFTSDEYQPIEGATSATFTYDWFTYDQSLFKLVVTSGGTTYESNVIQIDSYAWVGLIIEQSMNENLVTYDPDQGFLMCPTGTITNTINSPYSIVQWYKNGEAIEGATSTTYVITEPGNYTVVASPEYCPDSTTESDPIVVVENTDCTAGTQNPAGKSFVLYPNPANSVLNVQLGSNNTASEYVIFDVTGKKLAEGTLKGSTSAINIENLANGTYLIKIGENGAQASQMFIKQ